MASTNNTQTPAAAKTEAAPRNFTVNDVQEALMLYGKGVVSGLSLKKPIQLYKKNSKIRDLITKCIVTNGGILLGCIILFKLLIIPFVNKCFPPTVVPGDVDGETREINSRPTSVVIFLYNYVILTGTWLATKILNAPSFEDICKTFNSCRLNPLTIK